MCGIIGIASKYKYIKSIVYLINGLKLLQNRGYDSAGISMVMEDNKNIKTIKYASDNENNSIEKLEKEMDQFYDSDVGIAHTRWATHGGKTDYNAHPHNDNHNILSIVHNGIIENHNLLRNMLKEKGYIFFSETDSEIIVNMISYYMSTNSNHLIDSIKKTMDLLEGTYAVSLVCSLPEYRKKVYTFCHGSPIIVGFNKKEGIAMASSEILGFGNHDSFTYTTLKDKTIAILSENGITFSENDEDKRIWSTISGDDEKIQVEYDKTKYKSWMEKEIFEQPESILRSFNNGGRFESEDSVKLGGLDKIKDRLTNIEYLILLGCGTSYYAGMYALPILKKIGGFINVSLYDGGEFTSLDIPRFDKKKIGYVFLSQSGETKDLHKCFSVIDHESPKIGIVNVVNSMISRQVDCGIYLNAGREVSVASTKSFTNMVIVLYLLAAWFSGNIENNKNKKDTKSIIKSLKILPKQVEEVLDLTISNVSESISKNKNMFILGKGIGEAVSMEGSLKLKEIAYIHSEGKSSSSLKHGPFALIENKLPILFIHLSSFGEENYVKVENSLTEVSARNSYPIVITDIPNNKNTKIYIPYNEHFGGLLANIVIQKIALEIAYLNRYNPDYPRNLAKVVTVE